MIERKMLVVEIFFKRQREIILAERTLIELFVARNKPEVMYPPRRMGTRVSCLKVSVSEVDHAAGGKSRTLNCVLVLTALKPNALVADATSFPHLAQEEELIVVFMMAAF